MYLFINQTVINGHFIVKIDNNGSVLDIKKQIKDKTNYPIECQKLIFDDILLDDLVNVKVYGINTKNNIKLIIKPIICDCHN